MKRLLSPLVGVFLLGIISSALPQDKDQLPPPATASADWPQFRGPDGQGHANARGLALTWSEQENISWKVEVPGLGWSSPAIQGQRIWLTAAVDKPPSLRVLCLDRATGRQVHDLEVFAPKSFVGRHPKNSFATPCPIIEKDRVYVHFGQMGTACLSTEGKILWTTVLPHKLYYGPSSTPVLFADLLIVPCHGTDVSYTAALDKQTGKERWKTSGGGNSHATPLVIRVGEVDQLVCNLVGSVVAYEVHTGKQLWSASQGNEAQVPRPIFGHGLVFVGGGYFNPVLQAIRPDGKGDVTKTHVVWKVSKQVPQNPSPLLVGDELYMVSDLGIASCLDARTGKVHWSERLAGAYSASPLSADGRIYFSNEDGVTTVIAPETTFRKLATNRVEGRTLASLAVAGQEIYLRTDSHLYRIEKK